MNKIDFKKQWKTFQIEQQPEWPNQQEYKKTTDIYANWVRKEELEKWV